MSRQTKRKAWIAIELLNANGKPVPYEPYRIAAPDGKVAEGCTDEKGLARLDGIDPGTCTVAFPALDKQTIRER